METKNKKIHYFSIHDFGFGMPGMEDIMRLKEIIPGFKITCFTIPFPKEFFVPENQKHFKIEKYKRWAKIINSYDWLEIGFHGFAHTHNEMNCDYDKAIILLKASENLFKKIGLNYKKIFAAPYWQYSYDSLTALRDRGYTIAIDRNHVREVPEGSKVFIYNHSLEEPFPDIDKVISHGHVTHGQVKNNLESCYPNIVLNIKPDARFGFCSEDCVKEMKGGVENASK